MYARRLLTTCYLFNEEFAHRIVDLEVIKLRTNVPSETTQTRDNFRSRLLKRDVRCVWTGVGQNFGGVGLHIIPYKRGPEVRFIIFYWKCASSSPFRLLFQWFRLIIANRPKYGENVGTLNDINDIRNGVFANAFIHSPFDQRFAVVLKVCRISPPALVLPDLYVTTNPLRLQTLFLKEKTFLHATTEKFRQTSRIRLIAVTRYNGWKRPQRCCTLFQTMSTQLLSKVLGSQNLPTCYYTITTALQP